MGYHKETPGDAEVAMKPASRLCVLASMNLELPCASTAPSCKQSVVGHFGSIMLSSPCIFRNVYACDMLRSFLQSCTHAGQWLRLWLRMGTSAIFHQCEQFSFVF